MQKSTKVSVPQIKFIYIPKVNPDDLVQMKDSEQVHKFLIEDWDTGSIYSCVEVKVLLMNGANKMLGIFPLFKGGLTSATIDLKLIFVTTLENLASRIIIAINRPSGNITEDKNDIEMKQQIKDACKIMQIALVDYLIVSPTRYTSFADEGLL